MSIRPAWLVSALPVAALAAGYLVAAPHAASASTFVPYQFIAKEYTEVLGRAPDPTGWTTEVDRFNSDGCSATTLAASANHVFDSGEFSSVSHSNYALVEMAYRLLMNREPDSGGVTTWISYLNAGSSLDDLLAQFESSPEFTGDTSIYCSTLDTHFSASQPPPNLSPSGPGYTGGEAGLQSLLSSAAPGSTVTLAQRALIPITQPLVIPAGVTLTTYGSPPVADYADMGRLARQAGWGGSTSLTAVSVIMTGGSAVSHVWVDGDRPYESSYNRVRYNLEIESGHGTTLTYDRIGDPAGATDMQVDSYSGGNNGFGQDCTGTQITHNLIDAYTANHDGISESDGISDGCEQATIEDNDVVDASDVAIILFGNNYTTQASTVEDNTIVQAGHGAHALLSADGSTGGSNGTTTSLAGSTITDNSLWSAPGAVSTFGIADGTWPLFGTSAAIGTGASITGNTSPLSVSAEVGIGVSGMLSTTVTGNSLNWTFGTDPTSSCGYPPGGTQTPYGVPVGASVSEGYASGTIQSYTDVSYTHCWDVPPS